MKNKFISFLLASLMVVSMVIPVQAADTFRDVHKGYWAYGAIEEMAADGVEVTEKNVASRINELRIVYPQGMSCTNENFHYIDPKTGKDTGNSGCYALAMYVFDYVFGYGAFDKAKATTLTDQTFGSIQPGDHIRIKDLPHSVVVLETGDDYVKVVEGNFNKKVYWDNVYTKEELLGYQNAEVYSCY